MFRPGRQNPRIPPTVPEANSCAICHGTDHTEKVCAACHAQIYQEHVLGAGRSYGPGPGQIGTNWDRNIKAPHYAQMPRKVVEMGCDPCHAQAGATDPPYWDEGRKQYADRSSLQYRNGCIACHTRHRFDPAEARRPEACMTCHMGPDRPNWEAYSTFETRRHLPDRRPGLGLAAAPGGGALGGPDVRLLPHALHGRERAAHLQPPHDAEDRLGHGGPACLHGLYRDGIIAPARRARSAGLLAGERFVATEVPGGTFWPAGLYYDVSAIEREYFDMFFFANLKSYKGAFHMSPDYAWWYGYAETLGHLLKIRDEAERLRLEHRTAARTSFMLYTGPLMVLAVVGTVWAARAVVLRRRGRR